MGDEEGQAEKRCELQQTREEGTSYKTCLMHLIDPRRRRSEAAAESHGYLPRQWPVTVEPGDE